MTGRILEQQTGTTRSGLADTRVRLSVNLRGNPAMSPREFAAARPRTIVGASVTLTAPASQYYETKLINLGTNRWSFKPEVGVSVPKGRWDLDAYVGAWFYTSNSNFYPGGAVRTQDPVLTVQGHASYTVRPRLWVAADGTWYRGGSARVGDGEPSTSLNNSRLGVTVSFPVGNGTRPRWHAWECCADGLTVAVAWQVLWLSRDGRDDERADLAKTREVNMSSFNQAWRLPRTSSGQADARRRRFADWFSGICGNGCGFSASGAGLRRRRGRLIERGAGRIRLAIVRGKV